MCAESSRRLLTPRAVALRCVASCHTALHRTALSLSLHLTLVWLRSGIRRRLRGIEYAKARR